VVLAHFEPSVHTLLAGKNGVDQTFQGMLDEETGLRGYIDTSDAVFLARYPQGVEEVLQGNAASASLSTIRHSPSHSWTCGPLSNGG